MDKTYKPSLKMWAIDTDKEHILHRITSEDYTKIRHIIVREEDLPNWEEIALEDIPKYTKTEYSNEVERLIALKYSHGKEIEVNREKDSKPDKYTEYLDYIEQCKIQARETLSNRNTEVEEPGIEEVIPEEISEEISDKTEEALK